MDINMQELLTDARKIDDLVQSVWQKYDGLEGQDMPREENWLLEYAILNRGHDFLNYFLTLNKLQEELEAHEGEFCFSDHSYSSAAPKLKDCGLGVLGVDFKSTSGSYNHVCFQLHSPGLVPGNISKIHNTKLNRKDYFVELAIAAEESFLINNSQFNGFHVYVDESSESHLIYGPNSKLLGPNLWQDAPSIWRMGWGNIMVGENVQIVIGTDAVMKSPGTDFMLQDFDPKKQTPLEYIQSMKETHKKRNFPY